MRTHKFKAEEVYDIMFKEYPDVVTAKQLSKMLGFCIKKAYDLLRSGAIQSIPCGTNYRIAKLIVIDYVLIATNPSDIVDKPKIRKYHAAYYTEEELKQLFEIFKGDRMELVVQLTAYYGFRRSEVLGLRWSAIDFEKDTITVNHSFSNDYVDGKEVVIGVDRLKSKSSYRVLPLMPHIKDLLIAEKEK